MPAERRDCGKLTRIMFDIVRHDLRRCGDRRSERIRELIFNPGMWAVLSYRFRRWVHLSGAPKFLRLVLNPMCSLVQLCTLILTNIDLPLAMEIGPGLYIPHTGYIVVNGLAKIGANCTLTQGVTIGHRGGGRDTAEGSPVIGNRVYVGPAAAIIGPISIGDDALIGVGAVVIKSVPRGGVMVGNPARLVSTRGSFDLITYTGMESDDNRRTALATIRAEPTICES
jgi:serine O-acetyltransferase